MICLVLLLASSLAAWYYVWPWAKVAYSRVENCTQFRVDGVFVNVAIANETSFVGENETETVSSSEILLVDGKEEYTKQCQVFDRLVCVFKGDCVFHTGRGEAIGLNAVWAKVLAGWELLLTNRGATFLQRMWLWMLGLLWDSIAFAAGWAYWISTRTMLFDVLAPVLWGLRLMLWCYMCARYIVLFVRRWNSLLVNAAPIDLRNFDANMNAIFPWIMGKMMLFFLASFIVYGFSPIFSVWLALNSFDYMGIVIPMALCTALYHNVLARHRVYAAVPFVYEASRELPRPGIGHPEAPTAQDMPPRNDSYRLSVRRRLFRDAVHDSGGDSAIEEALNDGLEAGMTRGEVEHLREANAVAMREAGELDHKYDIARGVLLACATVVGMNRQLGLTQKQHEDAKGKEKERDEEDILFPATEKTESITLTDVNIELEGGHDHKGKTKRTMRGLKHCFNVGKMRGPHVTHKASYKWYDPMTGELLDFVDDKGHDIHVEEEVVFNKNEDSYYVYRNDVPVKLTAVRIPVSVYEPKRMRDKRLYDDWVNSQIAIKEKPVAAIPVKVTAYGHRDNDWGDDVPLLDDMGDEDDTGGFEALPKGGVQLHKPNVPGVVKREPKPDNSVVDVLKKTGESLLEQMREEFEAFKEEMAIKEALKVAEKQEKKEARKATKAAKKNTKASNGPTCFACGVHGHVATHCPGKKKPEVKREAINNNNLPIPTYQTIACKNGDTVICSGIRVSNGVLTTGHSCLDITHFGAQPLNGSKWYGVAEDLAFTPQVVNGTRVILTPKFRAVTKQDVGIRVGIYDPVNHLMTFGHVTAVEIGQAGAQVTYDCSTQKGCCGSPVVDENGKIIGIHVADKTATGITDQLLAFFRSPRTASRPVVAKSTTSSAAQSRVSVEPKVRSTVRYNVTFKSDSGIAATARHEVLVGKSVRV